MKRKLILASLFLMSIAGVNAQSTGNQKSGTNKSTKKKTDSKTNQTGTNRNQTGTMDQSGTTNPTGTNRNQPGTTNQTGTTNQNATGTTGMDHGNMSGMNNMTDTSGELTSTGRYAAMGARQGSLHNKDMKFIMLANSSNALELQLSQLALQRATNQSVRDYASMMVEHHTMAGNQMKQLLSSKGAMIPDSALMTRHRMQMEMLQNLQGADFDRAYMRIMVNAHEEDLDEYEDETTDARDADIRAMATRMLPILRTHYTRAKEIRKQL